MNSPNYARLKGPGDFEAPAELEGEPGPIWGDQNEIEILLVESETFPAGAAEIMADYLLRGGDKYDKERAMRLFDELADKCRRIIDAKEAELMESPE